MSGCVGNGVDEGGCGVIGNEVVGSGVIVWSIAVATESECGVVEISEVSSSSLDGNLQMESPKS